MRKVRPTPADSLSGLWQIPEKVTRVSKATWRSLSADTLKSPSEQVHPCPEGLEVWAGFESLRPRQAARSWNLPAPLLVWMHPEPPMQREALGAHLGPLALSPSQILF